MPYSSEVNVAHFYHALDTPAGHEIYAEHRKALQEANFPVDAIVCWVKPGEGFEQVTLRKLHAWAKEHPSTLILYAHTKGAWHQDENQNELRRALIHYNISQWKDCVDLLSKHDTVGCHWTDNSFFAGNFWWATASYIASLKPVSNETRYHAESWVGTGNPSVHDLLPLPFEPSSWGVHWDFTYRRFTQHLGKPHEWGCG